MSDNGQQLQGQEINTNVVSGVALVLFSLIQYIQGKLPGISVIYDEQLGFDSGARLIRDSNNLRDEFNNKIPAMLYRRSVLKPQEQGMSRRSVVNQALNPTNDKTSNSYKAVFGTFDFEFNYITSKMSQFENFEVSWLSEDGIPAIKDLPVNIPGIGDLIYHITFNPLDDKIINSQGNYYKAVVGSMQVRGTYLVFNGSYPHIQEIRKSIFNIHKLLLESEVIK